MSAHDYLLIISLTHLHFFPSFPGAWELGNRGETNRCENDGLRAQGVLVASVL